MVATLQPHVKAHPATAALIDDDGTTTWGQLDMEANRWVDALRRAGLTPGQRLAVMSANRRKIWEVFVACLHAGIIVVPVNPDLPEDQARYVVGHSGAIGLVVDAERRTLAARATAHLGLRARVVIDGPEGDGFISVNAFLTGASAAEPADQVSGGPMFYTSGTTGQPKGVVSAGVTAVGGPVAPLAEAAAAVCGTIGFPPGGTAMIVGPSYHSGQFVLSTFPILYGQKLIIRRGPDPVDILERIDRHRVTNVLLLPADFAALLQLPDERRQSFDGSSLAVVLHGGAPTPPDIKRRMIDWFGPRLIEYYGATEGGLFALATSHDWSARPGTVGQVLPFMECRIVRFDGTPAPPGEDGRVYFRHRGGATFHYHDDPERTAAAHLEPGLFTVGDIGHLDADGYLFVTAREADLIATAGTKVAPGKVEAALAEHPAVADVAVFGVPAPEGEDEVRAAVVLHAGHTASDDLAAAIRSGAAGQLSPHEVPRRIEFTHALPRSAAGKILRTELRAHSS